MGDSSEVSKHIIPNVGETEQQWKDRIKCNVDHLETILLYEPVDSDDDTPNVVGSSSSKKTTCSGGVTTGKAYIAAN